MGVCFGPVPEEINLPLGQHPHARMQEVEGPERGPQTVFDSSLTRDETKVVRFEEQMRRERLDVEVLTSGTATDEGSPGISVSAGGGGDGGGGRPLPLGPSLTP